MKPVAAALFALIFPILLVAQPLARSDIQSKTASFQKMDGFIPLYWDEENGKLWMQVSRFGEELLYYTSLPAGIGSNPIGLDRGQTGETLIVEFERIGPKVLMIAPNYRFRALSTDASERRAVTESFARSVIASFKVEAADAASVLVDATDFFLSDQHHIAQRLRAAQQGSYGLDRNRSAIYLPRTRAFPRNTEVEAILTFATTERPGNLVRQLASSHFGPWNWRTTARRTRRYARKRAKHCAACRRSSRSPPPIRVRSRTGARCGRTSSGSLRVPISRARPGVRRRSLPGPPIGD